jgi:hypothetical protein
MDVYIATGNKRRLKVMKILMVSGHATSGKDTFVKYFMENTSATCKRFAFADALKEIAKELYNWNGEKDAKGRQLLIDIGQIGREYFGNFTNINQIKTSKIGDLAGIGIDNRVWEIRDRLELFISYFTPCLSFWVDIVWRRMLTENLDFALISDWRFKSEYYNMILNFGIENVKRIRIERDVPLIDDISEKDLDDFKFDHIIQNNQDLGFFECNIRNFIANPNIL